MEGRSGNALRDSAEAAGTGLLPELVASLGAAGQCEINAVYAEGRCIASQLCLRTGPEYTRLKIAYDERYARYSPGKLLVERTHERCCRDPEVKRLNLASAAEWYLDWTPNVIPAYSVYVGLGRWSGRPIVDLLRLRFRYVRV